MQTHVEFVSPQKCFQGRKKGVSLKIVSFKHLQIFWIKFNIQDGCFMFSLFFPRHVSKISHNSENEFALCDQLFRGLFFLLILTKFML